MQSILSKELRPAIAMIELIFSLTIMGFVLMSAPMLIERSTQSSFVSLQQESIAAAETQIAMVMTAAWDHNNTDPTYGQPILNTQSGTVTAAVFPNCSAENPPGVSSSSGRGCKDYATTSLVLWASPIALDSVYKDIDDFNGYEANVTLYNSESYEIAKGDYLDQNISILTNVYYGDDTPRKADGTTSGGLKQDMTFSNPFRNTSSTTTNIKQITVRLTSNNPAAEVADKNIQLSAFMCNIGAPKELISNKAGL